MKNLLKAAILGASLSVAFAGAASADFAEDCKTTSKDAGMPGLMAGGVCSCIAEKVGDDEALQSEMLAALSQGRDVDESTLSPEVAEVRASCRPMGMGG